MSFLFWEDVPYLVYGNGDIRIVELKRDLSGVQEGGLHRLLLQTASEGMMLRCEGCRAIVRNGYIYVLFIDWPKGGRRREVCYRSQSLEAVSYTHLDVYKRQEKALTTGNVNFALYMVPTGCSTPEKAVKLLDICLLYTSRCV